MGPYGGLSLRGGQQAALPLIGTWNIKATDIQSWLINSINQQNIWIKLRVSGMPTNPVLQRHLSM